MLKIRQRPAYVKYIKNTAKVLFVAEAIAFAFSYGAWYKLNTDRDFRLFTHKNFNWALEGYYTIGETLSDQKTRENDLKIWQQEGKL